MKTESKSKKGTTMAQQVSSGDVMKIEDIEAIVKILKANDVTKFELEQNGTKLSLARELAIHSGQFSTVVTQHNHHAGHAHGSGDPAAFQSNVNLGPVDHASAKHAHPANWIEVKSPIVGTFYRRSSPDAEVYVKEGDIVKKGQTLCIVEAMKLMNEIESTAAGKIEKIFLTDGQVAEFGEVLFLINPQL